MATTIFSNIYQNNVWGCGSGDGSTADYTVPYRQFLSKWLRDNKIETVLDIGCGDWQSTCLIDWTGIKYTGIDCVPSLIESHKEKYGSDSISFTLKDILSQPLQKSYDVIILKDVIQHWPTSDIYRVLPQLREKSKYLLITNCRHQSYDDADIALGDFRPLNWKMKPLSTFQPQVVYSFHSKDVVLMRN